MQFKSAFAMSVVIDWKESDTFINNVCLRGQGWNKCRLGFPKPVLNPN